MKEYIIEIHLPNEEDPFKTIKSESPFMLMAKGDLINTRVFDEYEADANILRIVNIEHIIYGKEPTHKISIFTERAEDTLETRFS